MTSRLINGALKQIAMGTLFTSLLGWPSTAKGLKIQAAPQHRKSGQDQQSVPPTHVVIDSPLPASDRAQSIKQSSSSNREEKALPRFVRPEWVVVYVTVVYAFIAWLTLNAIKRQANTMEAQAKEAKESAADAMRIALATAQAAQKNADAANT